MSASSKVAESATNSASKTVKTEKNNDMWGAIISGVVSIVTSIIGANKDKKDKKLKDIADQITEQSRPINLDTGYKALLQGLEAKYGGSLKPSMKDDTRNELYDLFSDEEIAKLNAYSGKVIGDDGHNNPLYAPQWIRSGGQTVVKTYTAPTGSGSGSKSNILPTVKSSAGSVLDFLGLGGSDNSTGTQLSDVYVDGQKAPVQAGSKILMYGAVGVGGYLVYKLLTGKGVKGGKRRR